MSIRWWIPVALLTLSHAAPVFAQDPAEVEALAPLLMTEDRRAFDQPVLLAAISNPDPLVRQTVAMTLGRLGDARGVALLTPLLVDADQGVITNAFFAMGLLHDTTAVDAIISRLRAPDSLSGDAVGEAATALTRIGGTAAARFLNGVLSGSTDMPRARQELFVPNALLDGWNLGRLMPAEAMVHFANDTSTDLRWRSIYSLGRMRVPSAGRQVLGGIRDQSASIRETAAKWLVKRFADTGGLAPAAVRTALARALTDDQPGVRIDAAMSLATFGDSTDTPRIVELLSDGDPNVRVAGVSALGVLKGSAAGRALDGVIDRRDATWAMRHAALAALARVDTALFAKRAAVALASPDFRDRVGALQGWGMIASRDPAVFRKALDDPNQFVQAAALDAWAEARGDSTVAAAARHQLAAVTPAVRAAAASALRRWATVEDVDALLAAWRRSLTDPESDGRIAVVATLHALSQRQPDLLSRMDTPARRDFLQRPADPVVRAEVARTWPELAQSWGDKWPIETSRTLDEYRAIVRNLVLSASDTHVTVDVLGRGTIDIELLGHEAPLTVANFLRLVDQHYFDGNTWYRVVPDFVVQDGDRTGSGDGGPGWSIRDEINRERYFVPMAGMALSGPDTGGSQWFINLSAQPHLDGHYTIFGKVSGTYTALTRIIQGDVIRSIHR